MNRLRMLGRNALWQGTLVTLSMAGAAADAPTRVMPLGDSVTDGYTIPGGSRTQLWNDVVNSGKLVEFVGSQYNGPSSLGSHHHEGHPGWTVSDIAGQVSGWLASSAPQIVLLQIGTNDINMNKDPSGAPGRLSALIDQICAGLPAGGKLFVAQITPEANAGWNQQIISYNQQIPGIVQSKQNAGKPVFVVDLYDAIGMGDLGPDGVHPTAGGYAKLGNAWNSAINASLASGGSGTNVALGKFAFASSSSTPESSAVDGDTTTRWTANGNVRPSSLTVDLGANYPISRAETQFEFGDEEFYQYRIDSSPDNVNWSVFVDNTGNMVPRSLYVDYGSVTARYFRITVTAAQNAGDWPAIWEFQLYNGASGSSSPVASGHSYHIINANSGQYLDNPNGTNVHGTYLQQFPNTNSTAQQWMATSAGNGYWTFVNVAGGLAIDDYNWSTTPGTRIDEWDNWGGQPQQWRIDPVGDGTYKIISAVSGLNMEVQSASTAAGAPVGQWTDNGCPCQHWIFQAVN